MLNFSTREIIIVRFSLALAVVSTRYAINIRKYLKEFVAISKRVNNNDQNARMNTNIGGELGELALNYNKIIKDRNRNFEKLEYKNLQLKSILKSISHGVLALDIEGNILLINREAKSIIGCPQDLLVEGRGINFAVKDETILKQIIKFMGSKHNEKEEIELSDGRFCRIKLDPVYLQNNKSIMIGFIINLEDITERVRLENMRSDFVANVSHELKTPLTSISGFAETLKMNDDIDRDTRNRFLNIIDSEASRLKRLIDDILTLSFIESRDNIEYQESTNVYNVYKMVREMVEGAAEAKDIEIECICEDKSIEVKSDNDSLNQVILNLMDNAIKYTPKEGKVTVEIKSEENETIINIIDNGIGIPEEDIDRIFERFYRVDKARSRDIGGTGLGLAIAKHVVFNMGGKIEVKSKVNEGTTFTVRIPS